MAGVPIRFHRNRDLPIEHHCLPCDRWIAIIRSPRRETWFGNSTINGTLVNCIWWCVMIHARNVVNRITHQWSWCKCNSLFVVAELHLWVSGYAIAVTTRFLYLVGCLYKAAARLVKRTTTVITRHKGHRLEMVRETLLSWRMIWRQRWNSWILQNICRTSLMENWGSTYWNLKTTNSMWTTSMLRSDGRKRHDLLPFKEYACIDWIITGLHRYPQPFHTKAKVGLETKAIHPLKITTGHLSYQYISDFDDILHRCQNQWNLIHIDGVDYTLYL